jgi:pilus assembly protein Flp/PilA
MSEFLKKGGVKTMLFSPREKGQGLVEYALIFVFVILAVIVTLYVLGPAIGSTYSNIISELTEIS